MKLIFRWLLMAAMIGVAVFLHMDVPADDQSDVAPPAPELIRMEERNSLAEVLLLKKPAARLMYNHVYAVLGYDDSTGMLKIWNPHGQDFTPQGIPGPENGYETRHGIFVIPLAEFMEFFTFLAIEQN